jgi:hypothetical protein
MLVALSIANQKSKIIRVSRTRKTSGATCQVAFDGSDSCVAWMQQAGA